MNDKQMDKEYTIELKGIGTITANIDTLKELIMVFNESAALNRKHSMHSSNEDLAEYCSKRFEQMIDNARSLEKIVNMNE